MRALKQQVIGAGFSFFRATGLHRVLAPLTRGCGAILMLHHVRPWREAAFAPNRLLEIEPSFLDAALVRIKALGFEIVSMDDALRRLASPGASPFVTLTFDDGYIDLRDHALAVLERHDAPFIAYVTTGFADRTARLWWVELEAAVRRLDRLEIAIGATRLDMSCATPPEKDAAFRQIYWMLRAGPEDALLAATGDLAAQAGIDPATLVAERCLDWDGIRTLAHHPLATIGAHTATHPMLAKHDADVVRRELASSRAEIETAIGLPVRHLAYPVGDITSAGPRDYAIASELGFTSAVTTRPGMLFPGHLGQLTVLPRLSVNGNWQSLDALEVLLSGVPFALWNRGRRVVA